MINTNKRLLNICKENIRYIYTPLHKLKMRSKRLNFSVYQEVEQIDSDQYINVKREERTGDSFLKQLSLEDERTNWRVRFARRAVDVVTCKQPVCSCPSLGFRDTLYYGIIPYSR